MAEPVCCGEVMVHNSWARRYECADAYFALVDAGWGEQVVDDADIDEMPHDVAEHFVHWRGSFMPDGDTDA